MYQKLIYTKNGNFFFFEKTMKAYFKAVMLSLKVYENMLKFSFLMGGIRHIDCFHRMVIYDRTKIPLNGH